MASKPEKVVLYETTEDITIQAVGYKAGSKQGYGPRMFVRTRSGTVHCYLGVPRAAFVATLAVGAGVGKHLATEIWPRYASAQLQEGKEVVFTFKPITRAESKKVVPKAVLGAAHDARWAW